jgi:hypothetical protein
MKIEIQFWTFNNKYLEQIGYKLGDIVSESDLNLHRVNDHSFRHEYFRDILIEHDSNFRITAISFHDRLVYIYGETPKFLYRKDVIDLVNIYSKKVEDTYSGDVLILIFRDEVLSSLTVRRLMNKTDFTKIQSLKYT